MDICLFNGDVCVIWIMIGTWIGAISSVCTATIGGVYNGATTATCIEAIAGTYIAAISGAYIEGVIGA